VHDLSELFVVATVDCCFEHSGVSFEASLHFSRVDILTAADD
jgi:hypothetical protein